MRGCCLLVGSCDTAVNLSANSCCPLPPCCGWDLGSAWTHTLLWSCCVSLGLCWASPPRWWRLSEIVWCFFAFGPCTCPCTRWVYSIQWVPLTDYCRGFPSLILAIFFHFRWARYFSTSSGEWWFAHLWLFYIRFKFFVSIIVFVTSQLCLSVDYVDWQPWFHLTCHTFLLLFLLTRVQGQLASGDGVPLHPCCAIDNNQRVTRGQRARSRDLLAGTLAALQAHVCIWCGKTHITLSHLVGPHRCVSVLLCLFIRSEHYKNVSVTQKITTV